MGNRDDINHVFTGWGNNGWGDRATVYIEDLVSPTETRIELRSADGTKRTFWLGKLHARERQAIARAMARSAVSVALEPDPSET